MLPIVTEQDNSQFISATVGVKLLWIALAIAGVLNRNATCLLLCMICSVFLAGVCVYRGLLSEEAEKLKMINDYLLPQLAVEGFLGVVADNVRLAYASKED